MTNHFWKIGELADKTGLTVRTLHHYDEIGILSPSYRSEGDHRLYTEEDVKTLQQIVSMKALGFTLDNIKQALDRSQFSAEQVLGMHLDRIQTQMKVQEDLKERMEGMQRFLQTRTLTAEEFLDAIALMQQVNEMYTEEELAVIHEQGQKLGKETIISVEQEWPQLMENMKAHMDAGADPASPAVQALVKRWKELVEMFTGGNPQIESKMKKMYQDNPDAGKTFGGPGFDPKLFEYVGKAMEVMQ